MKTKEAGNRLRWYRLGALGGLLMAAGDWLLGCIPLQATDTGILYQNLLCIKNANDAVDQPHRQELF